MIGKQIKRSGFRDTLSYVLSKETAQIVKTNMLGTNSEELAQEFKLSSSLRPNLKKNVYHTSLSLPEGEQLTEQEWGQVTERYLNEMGFQGSQYVSVIHEDTEHQHVHIVASRVRLDGSVVSDSQDYKRSENAIRGIEREFGLTRVPSSHEVGRRAPTSGELRKALRESKPSTRASLQSLIDNATVDKPTMSEFVLRMQACNVGVQANIAKTNHISGISFTLDGEKMKGSDLGRRYTWQGLQKKGVSYEPIRDFQEVSRASKQAEKQGAGENIALTRDSARRRRKLERLSAFACGKSLSGNSGLLYLLHYSAKNDPELGEVLRRNYFQTGKLPKEHIGYFVAGANSAEMEKPSGSHRDEPFNLSDLELFKREKHGKGHARGKEVATVRSPDLPKTPPKRKKAHSASKEADRALKKGLSIFDEERAKEKAKEPMQPPGPSVELERDDDFGLDIDF